MMITTIRIRGQALKANKGERQTRLLVGTWDLYEIIISKLLRDITQFEECFKVNEVLNVLNISDNIFISDL